MDKNFFCADYSAAAKKLYLLNSGKNSKVLNSHTLLIERVQETLKNGNLPKKQPVNYSDSCLLCWYYTADFNTLLIIYLFNSWQKNYVVKSEADVFTAYAKKIGEHNQPGTILYQSSNKLLWPKGAEVAAKTVINKQKRA